MAVFIDGDNIPASLRQTVAGKAVELGEVVSTQVFCDLSLRADWANETNLDVTHCKGRPGKNCADMALCIAALDLAHRNLARVFVIASNDRDFEPLIRHLQRNGFGAVQLRIAKEPAAPSPEVEQAGAPAPAPATKPASAPAPATAHAPASKDGNLVRMVISHIAEKGGERGVPFSELNLLHKTLGVKISDTTEKSWRAWLQARPQYFQCDPKGPEARVRVVNHGGA